MTNWTYVKSRRRSLPIKVNILEETPMSNPRVKPRPSNTKRSLEQWMSAGSTINTTHGNKRIQSVQLNASGEVDDEPLLPIIHDEPVPLKLKQGSVSEGNVLIQSNASVDSSRYRGSYPTICVNGDIAFTYQSIAI